MSAREWRVLLVENEPRRVFEYFDALLELRAGRMRPHVAGRPELALGERLAPRTLFVGRPEERGQVEDLIEDHPALAPRVVTVPAAFDDEAELLRALDGEVAALNGATLLVLWDDQLNTPWALERNRNGMTLDTAARWADSLSRRGLRGKVRLVGISAQSEWTAGQVQDYMRFTRDGVIDEFRDRAHIDELVAEQTAEAASARAAYFLRTADGERRGAAGPGQVSAWREELAEAARGRLRAIARRLVEAPEEPMQGTWSPAFAGALLLDETAGTIELLEHEERPRWAEEGAWDRPDPHTGKRRLATHVLKEITARYRDAVRVGGEAEAERWTWRRLATGPDGLDLESVAYRLLRHLAEEGGPVERHEIVRAGLAHDSAVNTYASRIRSAVARHELIESLTRGGYRCARDLLLLQG